MVRSLVPRDPIPGLELENQSLLESLTKDNDDEDDGHDNAKDLHAPHVQHVRFTYLAHFLAVLVLNQR